MTINTAITQGAQMLLAEIKPPEQFVYPLLFEGKPVPSIEELSKQVASLFGPLVQASAALTALEARAKDIGGEFASVERNIIKKTRTLATLRGNNSSGSKELADDIENALEELGRQRRELKTVNTELPAALKRSQSNFEKIADATKETTEKFARENKNFPATCRTILTVAGSIELPPRREDWELDDLEARDSSEYKRANLEDVIAKAITLDLSKLKKLSVVDIGAQLVRLGAHALGATSVLVGFVAHWLIGIGAIFLWGWTAAKLDASRDAPNIENAKNALMHMGFDSNQLSVAYARSRALTNQGSSTIQRGILGTPKRNSS